MHCQFSTAAHKQRRMQSCIQVGAQSLSSVIPPWEERTAAEEKRMRGCRVSTGRSPDSPPRHSCQSVGEGAGRREADAARVSLCPSAAALVPASGWTGSIGSATAHSDQALDDEQHFPCIAGLRPSSAPVLPCPLYVCTSHFATMFWLSAVAQRTSSSAQHRHMTHRQMHAV